MDDTKTSTIAGGRIKRPYWLVSVAFIFLAAALLGLILGIYLHHLKQAIWSGIVFVCLFPIVNNLIKPYTIFSQQISCPKCGYKGYPIPYRSGWVSILFLIFGATFGTFLIRLGGPDIKCPQCNNFQDLVLIRPNQ